MLQPEVAEEDSLPDESDEAADMLVRDALESIDADIGEEGMEMVAALAQAFGVVDAADIEDLPDAAPDHDDNPQHMHAALHADTTSAQATCIDAVRTSLQALSCWHEA